MKVKVQDLVGLFEQSKKELQKFTETGKMMLKDLISKNNMDEGQFQTYVRAMEQTLPFEDVKQAYKDAIAYAKRQQGSQANVDRLMRERSGKLLADSRSKLGSLASSNQVAFLTIAIPASGGLASVALVAADLLLTIGYAGPADEAATALLDEFNEASYGRFVKTMAYIAGRPEIGSYKDLRRFIRRYDNSLLNPPRILDLGSGSYIDRTVGMNIYNLLKVEERTQRRVKQKRVPGLDRAVETIENAIKNGKLDDVFKEYNSFAMRRGSDRNLIERLRFINKNVIKGSNGYNQSRDGLSPLISKMDKAMSDEIPRSGVVGPDISDEEFEAVMDKLEALSI